MSRLGEVRRYFVGKYRQWVFDRALREFTSEPRSCLHPGSDVLSRLIYGWGNASWSALDEYLIATIEGIYRSDGPILECGSGLSTIILGVLGDNTGREVWTLEHHTEWGERVSNEITRIGVTSVHLCVNPLIDYGEYAWYDPPLAEMPRDFALVVCDGPPGSGHGGRYGMLPIMKDYLADGAIILIDDFEREDEKTIAQRWADSLGATVKERGAKKPFAEVRVSPKSNER